MLVDEQSGVITAHSDSNALGMLSNAGLADIRPRKLDIGLIGALVDLSAGNYSLYRFREVNKAQLRGKLKERALAMPHPVIEITMGAALEGRWIEAGVRYAQYLKAEERIVGDEHNKPVHVGPWRLVDAENKNDYLTGVSSHEMSLALALGTEFIRPMHWAVTFGYEGGGSVRCFTDPAGAAETFRLRDIPEGKKRRTALRHWVEQHWRQKRDGDLTQVRKHLRGAQKFTWNGLTCLIEPAADDLKKLAETNAT